MSKPQSTLWRRLSLRWKLTLWVMAIFLFIQGTLMVVMLLFYRGIVMQSFDVALSERGRMMVVPLGEIVHEDIQSYLHQVADRNIESVQFERFSLSVYDETGRRIAASSPLETPATLAADEQLPLAASLPNVPATQVANDNRPALRCVVIPYHTVQGKKYYLWLGTTMTHVATSVRTVRNILLVMLPTSLIAVTIAGWYLAGVAVAPLKTVQDAAAEIKPQSIDQHIDIDAKYPELEALKDELEAARRRMQQGYESQRRFILNVSHEIKTPIAVLLTEAQTLRMQETNVEELTAFVESVEQEMRRLGHMAESFLLLTQIQGGKREPRTTVTPANDLVLTAVQSCITFAEQTGVHLSPTLLDTVSCDIPGDPALLDTMVGNLIRNAIRFSPCGETIDINIQAHTDADMIDIVIRDRGPGVPPEIIDKLFDRFTQSASEQKRKRGTGLGLQIAQSVAELHGGSIAVANCADGGCSFTITLPIADFQAA